MYKKNKSEILSNLNLRIFLKSFELIHMDLFGPTRSASLSGKKYGYVLVDDFSRLT